ncbi:hypothetical protein CONPUDRAFT_147778 [Coniophora puteana RWD-64-598 SS2]|uniref:RNI-like protein n=1 Tax=Coniophora puteana (strain RWD-64-598) TaxID=741705 RepID=R7SFE0_CONPW|nr:uncharacterized protein CONPUDRAFT_147778 [Coniophora puteana RWD-64-598 SS2]EIW74462.1 hypothetical protein CONPUDRAFT_147778 [Coniophora puteana RWD-64-598 SS2]
MIIPRWHKNSREGKGCAGLNVGVLLDTASSAAAAVGNLDVARSLPRAPIIFLSSLLLQSCDKPLFALSLPISSSYMSRAFDVPELRLEVCSHIESQETLAALAQTSSTFLHPSLDRLWSGELQPVSIWSVINLLEEGIVKNDFGKIVDLVLNRNEHTRFFSYTHRIRYLDLNLHLDREHSIYESALLKLVSPPYSLERSFPRLRYLTLGAEALSTEGQMTFLPPLLSSLTVTGLEDRKLVDELVHRCPSLQSLDLALLYPFRDKELKEAVSLTVVKLFSLSTLRFTGLISSDAIRDLSRSSCLRRLSLINTDFAGDALSGSKDDTLQFQALEFLEVSFRTIESTTTLLQRLDKMPRVLKIRASVLAQAELQAFFSFFSQARGDKLEELILNTPAAVPPCTYTSDLIKPLMYLTSLRLLWLGIHSSISIAPGELYEFLRGFPKLETLHFNPTPITVDFLASITTECPMLKDVFLPIETSAPIEISTPAVMSMSSHPQQRPLSLHHAHFSLTELADVSVLTRTLVSHFPSIQALTLDHNLSTGVSRLQTGRQTGFDCIEPLRQLCMMTALSIKLPHPLALADADLTELATALPHLTHLRLLGDHPPTQLSRIAVTLDGVWALTSICTNLRALGINFSAISTFRSFPLKQRLKSGQGLLQNRTLRHLDIPGSYVSAAVVRDLAVLLAIMFPRLYGFGPRGPFYMGDTCCRLGLWIASLQRELKGKDVATMSVEELRSIAQDHCKGIYKIEL